MDQRTTNTAELPQPVILRRVLYGPSELRPAWRLLIFAGIVFALGKASSLALGRLLGGADDDSRFLVSEVTDFLVFLLASWIMGRVERRTIADYGLPWRRMFSVGFR